MFDNSRREWTCACGRRPAGHCDRCNELAVTARSVLARAADSSDGRPGIVFDLPDGRTVARHEAGDWLRSVMTLPATPRSAGRFVGYWVRAAAGLCPVCNTGGGVSYRLWVRGCGCCEEIQYYCQTCVHSWWTDDPDAVPGHDPGPDTATPGGVP